jgi:hypothetical protein
MKKILAIFLSALLICISLAPMSLAVVDPGIATRVMEGKYNTNNTGTDVVTGTTFTVAITVPAVKKLTGVNLYVKFDPEVLAVKNADLAGSYDVDDNYNACKTAKSAGMKVYGVFDKSSEDYVEEMKNLTDKYVFNFRELI